MGTTIVNLSAQKQGPGCLVSVLWYAFVGWWASLAAVVLAWICMLTVLGIPLGVAIINKLPKIVALREPGNGLQVIVAGGATIITTGSAPQRPFILRALYFVVIGWWLSMIVMMLGWACCATLIGMPLGFWLFDKTPAVLSLHR